MASRRTTSSTTVACRSVGLVAMVGMLGLMFYTDLRPSFLMGKSRASSQSSMDQLARVERLHEKQFTTQKLDLPCCDQKIDSKGLYGDDKDMDLEHPNRIDQYGSLFQDDENEAPAGVWKKVTKLKNSLIRLARMQRHFMDKLDEPIKVSESIEPGPPGRLGKRGVRGPVGQVGKRGRTGEQGRAGLIGRPGLPGDEGDRGPTGFQGFSGARGRPGVAGDAGPPGLRGAKGKDGSSGINGPPGYDGDNGPQGIPGQKGNVGPRGTSPRGPPGNPGPQGVQGVKGGKGGPGARGPAGAIGAAGVRGDPGTAGKRGPSGKDAMKLGPSKCGVQDVEQKNVCCGRAVVAWQDYYSAGAFLDVDTKACKFSENSVFYFTEMFGQGGQWTGIGQTALYSSTKEGFRVYLQSAAPNQAGMCCGMGSPSDFRDVSSVMYTDVETKACQFGGDPMYITGMSGRGSVNDLTGTSSYYPGIGPKKKWFRVWLGGATANLYGVANVAAARRNHWRLNWCGFGDVFPSGDMQLAVNQIAQDDFPCGGIRLLQEGTVTTNTAKLCCGITSSSSWKSAEKWKGEFFKWSTSLSYIPSVAGRTPSRVVHSVYIDFNDHTFAALGFDDRFVVRWSTNIEIKMAGTYAFQTCSDDGSNLYVSNQRVVNNDGLHGTYCREGSIYLGAGMIAITVNFFENGGGAVCYVKWKGPDTGETWQYTKPGRNEPDQDDKDARCYADRYSDLKNAFGYNTGSLFQHFRHYGMKEGRLFSCAEGAITVNVDASKCKFKDHTAGVENYGKDCWGSCNAKQGPCGWCGTGMCCRKDWGDYSNGCHGGIGIAGRGHVCVPRPEKTVWMTSLKGTSSHWGLAGINSFVNSNSKGFTTALLPTRGTIDTSQASSYGYQLQWCGVGEEK